MTPYNEIAIVPIKAKSTTLPKHNPPIKLVTPASRNLSWSNFESGNKKTKLKGTIWRNDVSIVSFYIPEKSPAANVSFDTSQIVVMALPKAQATVHARFPIVVNSA